MRRLQQFISAKGIRTAGFQTLAIDLALLLPLAIFICFFRLDAGSIHFRDEGTHVRAIEEMWLSGHWWLPTVDGEPYFHKPPLKMWLTFLPLAIFGPSTFAFRFLDALAGVVTCLLLYSFGRIFLRSRIAGIVAAVGLLGCESYIFGHGVRAAVQDSMLIFLNVAALVLGWRILNLLGYGAESGSVPKNKPRRLAIGLGLIIGCALLTKSAAGLMPAVIAVLYLLFTGKLFCFVKNEWNIWVPVAAIALLLPATYYVPHCLFTPGACSIAFQSEVYDRVTDGFHNSSQYSFYIERLFADRQAVPPELLVFAVLLSVFLAATKRDRTQLFLLLWALVPPVIFTFIPSRLTWYISTSFPAMALLVGNLFSVCLQALKQKSGTLRIGASLLLIVGVVLLGGHLKRVGTRILQPRDRVTLDFIAEDINRFAEDHPGQGGVVSLRRPPFSLYERAHGGMIEHRLTEVDSTEAALKLIDAKTHFFILTNLDSFAEILAAREVLGYRYLPPLYDRNNWMVAVVLKSTPDSDEMPPPSLTPTKRIIDFGEADEELFGLGQNEMYGTVGVQSIVGDLAGAQLEADLAMKKFGATAALSVANDDAEPRILTISVNDVKLESWTLKKGGLKTFRFNIPPLAMRDGKNSLFFKVTRPDGAPVDNRETVVKLNWLSVKLGIQADANKAE